jgi:hypothetical protein
MRISERHRQAAVLVVAHQFSGRTKESLAGEIGIARETLSRWLHDLSFRAEVNLAHEVWRKEITHIPLVHRRYRLEQLQQLYDEETDTMKKATLMRQAAEEIGGDVLAELEELKCEVYRPTILPMRGKDDDHHSYLGVSDQSHPKLKPRNGPEMTIKGV